ncbi:unnamed protein product [Musa hybrid cultivar]
MGSGSSKNAAASSSSGGVRKLRSTGVRVFNSSSCFGLSSIQKIEENGRPKHTVCAEVASKSSGGNDDGCDKVELACHGKLPCSHSSDGEQCGGDNGGIEQIDLVPSSNSETNAVADASSNTSVRSCSHLNFVPDDINFRLNRAVSLGSSESHPLFSAAVSDPRSDAGEHALVNLDSSMNRNDTQSLEPSSSQDAARINAGRDATISLYSNRSFVESRNTRHSHRRFGPEEPLEGSIRFSRTLSVGRLRNRVLRRTPFSDGLFGPAFLEDRPMWSSEQASGRQTSGGAGRAPSSSRRTSELLPDSSSSVPYQIARTMDTNDDDASDTQRRVGNHDVFEHRSAFLERRRRIRSQVRALQRLGSRFESLLGHDRSCILSGQHRTGHCTCRTNNQTANPDDDTSTRASISRIVMLAEALFEVLDEIHQQSVVLSSRPSFSAIGSVPAPKEVVECIPVKIYRKPSKTQNEEVAQCYICLVEYEEGDCMRMLPCNHEFHRTCIDKWLKEIHRVCPLCRRDVCTIDASSK